MNVYEIVTSQIVAQLESGVVPWHKPWSTDSPCNLVTGKPYRGINVWLLAMSRRPSKYWMTFKQLSKMGGSVRKGEKASIVTYWNVGEEKLDAKSGKLRRSFVIRYYNVFNASQIDGLESLGLGETTAPVPNIDVCDAIVDGMPNAPAMNESNAAYYTPSTDTVSMPPRDKFTVSEEYYSTLFHELSHSTAHAKRLNREDGIKGTHGSAAYAKEELIAELSASMLCGVSGVAPLTVSNSAAYIATWIERLRGDSKLIVSAASHAQKSADYIRNVKADVADIAEVKETVSKVTDPELAIA